MTASRNLPPLDVPAELRAAADAAKVRALKPVPTAVAKPRSRPKKRKSTKLSLCRRLECFRCCCAALVTTERNTLRRLARLRHALAALDLRSVITSKELGAQVLEAQDRQAGNTFSLLTAADRQAMPKPAIRWLIPGLIPSGDLTIIGGRPKVGKTRLAVAAARALLQQEDFLGFGSPPSQPPVILVTDDQGDASTNNQLEQLAIWDHPRLLWVRRFRVTEHDLDELQDAIKAHPGAVVIVDSLRSITRSCPFGENDPEIGALIYELKTDVMDAGGSLLLIHHCNKSSEATGTEALSGHSAIAGAASTILTLHYLNAGKVGSLPMKDTPDRRLACESRDSLSSDLVVTLDPASGRWSRTGEHSAWLVEHQADEKRTRKLAELTEEQRQVLEAIGGLKGPNGGTCRQIAEILHNTYDPSKSQMELIRKQAKSMVRRGLLREIDGHGFTLFAPVLPS
ncbi:AAA family ATPase [Synechococcus sp. CCAP 1479/9]|uniref:AAA family ATPase n=1 Tax=Synechococcus sp. CCAP 1479/9 TaxID=1221593 RepID=UPI001C23C8D6|nr:AAA family ATPase [Synechococcus sp. CCAP 1479/9]